MNPTVRRLSPANRYRETHLETPPFTQDIIPASNTPLLLVFFAVLITAGLLWKRYAAR